MPSKRMQTACVGLWPTGGAEACAEVDIGNEAVLLRFA